MHSSTATPEFETIRDGAVRARFERDAIPLLDGFYPQAMKMTATARRLKTCCVETAAKAFAGFSRVSRRHQPRRLAVPDSGSTPTSAATGKQQRRPVQWLTDEITDGQLLAEARHSSTGLRSAEDQVLDLAGRQRRQGSDAAAA